MTSLSLKSLWVVATRDTVMWRHSGLLLLALVLILTFASPCPATRAATSVETEIVDSDKKAILPDLELVPASRPASSNGKDPMPGITFQSEKLKFEVGHRKKDQSSFHLADAEDPASIGKNYGRGKQNPFYDGDTQASIEYDLSPGLKLIGEYHSITGPDRGKNGAQNEVRTKQAIEWKRGGTTASFALSRDIKSSSWSKQTDSKLSAQDFSVQHKFNTSGFLRSIAFRHTATVSEAGRNVTDKNTTNLQIVSGLFSDASLNFDYTLRASASGKQSTEKMSFDSGSVLGKNLKLNGYQKIDTSTAGATTNKTSLSLDGDLSSTSAEFKLKGLYETGLSQTGTDDKAQFKFQSAFGSGKTKVAFDGDILRHNSAKTSGNNLNNQTRLSIAALGNPRLQIEAAYKQTLQGIADAVESFQQTDMQLSSEISQRTTLLASFVQTDNLPAFHQTIRDLRIQNDWQTARLSVGVQQLTDATDQQSTAPYFQGHLDLGRQLPEWASETALIGSFSEPLPPELTKWLEAQETNDLFPKVKKWEYLKTPSWFATKSGIDVSWKAPSLTGNKPTLMLGYNGMLNQSLYLKLGIMRNPEIERDEQLILDQVDRHFIEIASRINEGLTLVARYAKDRDYQNLDNNSDSALLGLRLTVSPKEALELVVVKTDRPDSFRTAYAYGLQYYNTIAEDHLLALRAIVSELPSDSTSGFGSNRGFRIDFAYTKEI